MIKFLDCGVCTVWSSNDRLLCGNSEHVTLTSMATLSECSVCIHCVSCAHANQLMFFCVLTYACLHDLTTHLSSSGTLVMWAGIQTQVLMWVPPFIYTHTQASTVVTCVVAAWWNRTNLALVASCSASENLHRRNLEIFCQVKKTSVGYIFVTLTLWAIM